MMRRPGRPPLDADDPTSVRMGFRLPAKKYDELYARARDARMSLSEFIRDRLRPTPTDTKRQSVARK
jgi:hypothetical protein